MPITPMRKRPAYQALAEHHAKIEGRHLRELFAEDPARGERLTRRGRRALPRLLEEPHHRRDLGPAAPAGRAIGLEQRRDAMFAGERINVSENRSVLHVALRMPKGTSLIVDGIDVVAEVHEVLDRMAAFADQGPLGRSGRATPANRSATSSTSASAGPTWAR